MEEAMLIMLTGYPRRVKSFFGVINGWERYVD